MGGVLVIRVRLAEDTERIIYLTVSVMSEEKKKWGGGNFFLGSILRVAILSVNLAVHYNYTT